MVICSAEKCTGCMACMNICPCGAIKAGQDSSFKTIPVVDENICKKCDLCKKICPEVNKTEYNAGYEFYAAWKKDGMDTTHCASGAVSAALCEYVINNGGVVFGAGYKDGKVCQIAATDIETAELIKGSKYVQSDTGDSYKEAKEFLDSGKTVLYTGTPCIIAGLKNFLRKDYDNLITADIVCHGAPPHKFLDDYISELNLPEKHTAVRFRGDEDYFFTVYNGDKILFRENAVTNVYYRAYYNKILMRDNCYRCRYATDKNRPGDITLGDFWGINKETLPEDAKGKISLVIVNTKKGEALFNKADIPFQKREAEEAIKGNAQLKAPCPENKERTVFLDSYGSGFKKAVYKTSVRKNIQTNKRNLIMQRFKSLVKKVLKV